MTARRGKIARLPLALREELNSRLLEGRETAKKLCAWLNELDEVKELLATFNDGNPAGPIDDRNISDWRQGGFNDWLRRRDHILETKEMAQWSMKLAKASGGNLTEGASAIVAGQILEFLETLAKAKQDSENLTPEQIVAIGEATNTAVKSIASLRRGDHDREILNQNERRLTQGDEKLAIEREKFQRETARLFVEWAANKRALEIADGEQSNSEKIEQLGQMMFGETWKAQPAPGTGK